VEGAPGDAHPATIAEILPSSNPATRTVTVRVVLDNPGGALRTGMFARLRFPGDGPASAVVPATAIVRRGPLTGVFVVDGGVARLRWITLGHTQDGRVEAQTGLEAGERIVAAPPAELADGRRIELTR
jgi:multidrug efflux pump subunit AcrA (membrane-fusion protein)